MPNAAHLHLILNHFPIIGAAIVVIVLGYGIVIKNDRIKQLGMFLIVLIGLITIFIFTTGNKAEGFIKGNEGVVEENIEPHKEFAKISMIAMEFTALVSLIGLILFRKDKAVPLWFSIILFGLLLAVNIMMIYTGHLGGKISHSHIMTNF